MQVVLILAAPVLGKPSLSLLLPSQDNGVMKNDILKNPTGKYLSRVSVLFTLTHISYCHNTLFIGTSSSGQVVSVTVRFVHSYDITNEHIITINSTSH